MAWQPADDSSTMLLVGTSAQFDARLGQWGPRCHRLL